MPGSTLLQELARFNAKERFFLIAYALDKPDFRLGEPFRAALENALNIPVPVDAYCAMDYHLDWICAALHVSNGAYHAPVKNEKPCELVKGNQEDVDLLVAFACNGVTQLVLIEAKGVGAWSNEQAKRKVERLDAIFESAGDRRGNVRPWYVLVSPRAPVKLEWEGWPAWALASNARPIHMVLPMPAGKISRVTRWDNDLGRASKGGEHWKIVDR